MQIANPIYDTVFKFLMEDTESAILLLSKIIDEEIVGLEFLPQENVQQLHNRSLTVYRLDFSAKIKTNTGNIKQVLIEIQKAKLPSDIMRFRRYLGEQYSKKTNCYEILDKQGSENKRYKAYPIITIYFLGYGLEQIKVPIIKVNRCYYDVIHNQEIKAREEFIESLTHDSYVIQISQLHEPHQTEIEKLLAIFDQDKHLKTDEHILDIDETQYPEKYRSLIRRLQQAIAEPEIRKDMDAEDEILADLQDLERKIARRDEEIKKKEQQVKEKERLLEQQAETLRQKLLELEEKNKMIAQLQQDLNKNS